jgi:uncharacterized protein YndB with AHSA1/START domain
MEFQHEIEIARNPAAVFDVLTDPAKLPAWQPTTVSVRRDRQGPLVIGERFDEVHRAMGREAPSTVEVVDFEPGKLFALRIVSGPLPLDGRWELLPTPTGTRLSFTGRTKSPGLMRLAKPMLARQFRGYHKRLKALLEQDA